MGGPDHARGLTGPDGLWASATPVRQVLDGLLPLGQRVLVAVSGGPDSVALLHLITRARPDLLLIVGHVRHGLRDDAADADAARAGATAVGADILLRSVTMARGEGPEDTARQARYAALADMAQAAGTDTVLLGHTADDQAETVLLRIARGTGIDGLAGMAVDTAGAHGLRLLRPLLGLRRGEVRSGVTHLPHVQDPSNDDPDQRRARARRQALPALGRLRPDQGDPVPALCRLADLARDQVTAMAQLTQVFDVGRYGPAVVVSRHAAGLPEHSAWQAMALRSAWKLLPAGGPPPPAQLIARALVLRHGQRLDGPGAVTVTASAHGWVVCPADPAELPTRSLRVGGSVSIPEHDMVVHCRQARAGDQTDVAAQPHKPTPALRQWLHGADWSVEVPWSAGPLSVAGRDRRGTRDARSLLQALPAGLRHLVPLLRDADGTLLAVADRALVPVQPGDRCLRITAESVSC